MCGLVRWKYERKEYSEDTKNIKFDNHNDKKL